MRFPGRCLAARPVVHGGQAALEVAAVTLGAVLGLAAIGAIVWIAAVRRRERNHRAMSIPLYRAGGGPPRQLYGTPVNGQPWARVSPVPPARGLWQTPRKALVKARQRLSLA